PTQYYGNSAARSCSSRDTGLVRAKTSFPAGPRKVKRPRDQCPGAVASRHAGSGLLHRDPDMHAERDVWHAVPLVDARRRPRERYVVLLVRLRQERTGEVAH